MTQPSTNDPGPDSRTGARPMLRDRWVATADAIEIRSVGIALPHDGDPDTHIHLIARGEPDDSAGHLFAFAPHALVALYVQVTRALDQLAPDPVALANLITLVHAEAGDP